MKRKYELNLYAPFQYEDLQDHFERMAARGWALESLGGYFSPTEKRRRRSLCATPWPFTPR